MKSLARFCYDHRRFVLPGWILLLVGLFALSNAFKGEYHTDFKLPGSDTQAAIDLLKERGVTSRTGFQGQIVFRADGSVKDAAVRQTMEKLFADIQSQVPG